MSIKVNILGDPYLLEGVVGEGEFCTIYRGVRQNPVEVSVVKMLRDQDLESLTALSREAKILTQLRGKKGVQGSEYFSQLIPQVVVAATPENVTGPGDFKGAANVYLWRSGFNYTYSDVAGEYPAGVDARTAIWMWKRNLEFLGWLHQTGYVHGSITPQHLLVHPRDHGSILVGWSKVTEVGKPLVANNPGDEIFYPKGVWGGDPVSAKMDIQMSARCLFCILGGDVRTGTLPDSVPEELSDLIYSQAGEDTTGVYSDAWGLLSRLDAVAKSVYGKNTYHPFQMPRGCNAS